MLFHSPSGGYTSEKIFLQTAVWGIAVHVIHTEIGQTLLSILYSACNKVIHLPRLKTL